MRETKKFNHATEITPEVHRCPPAGPCPAIFRTEAGSYIVVGKIVDLSNVSTNVRRKVGKGETAVEIPAGIIDKLS